MTAVNLEPGSLLDGRYRIDGFLNAGSMQSVYRCHDLTLDRKAVLKTPKDGVRDKRFGRGAEMSAKINHPNVAATFDYYESDAISYLIEEYVPGLDLGSRLENEFHFMDPALAAHVIHHIARAIFEAHRVGICHRDLKPSNVMTSADAGISVIKLTDFGISKMAQSEIGVEMQEFNKDPLTLTTSNTLLGALPYMSPECWDDWTGAGQPMDVWALGCIAFHLLSGAPPFGTGRAAIANVLRVQQGGPLPDKPGWFGRHATSKALQEDLWKIIQACLRVDPNARPKAAEIVSLCDELCYPTAIRFTGAVTTYPYKYPAGGTGDCGFLLETESGQSRFFHRSEYYGSGKPVVGQRVSYSVYPGQPNPRTSPILSLK